MTFKVPETFPVSYLADDYDWSQAMEYASFETEDVAEVLSADAGCNDEADWLLVVRLNDGRFGYLHAGCDYTGWDCQASGDSVVRDDLRTLMLNDVGEEERSRLCWEDDA